MLKDDNAVLTMDAITLVTSDGRKAQRVSEGVYLIHHFGHSHFLPQYEAYDDLESGEPFGVCDNIEQVLKKYPEISDPNRLFVVTLTPVRKSEEPSSGGWRWHKWGDYIGTQNPTCEYLHDEPEIEEVLCYHIYVKNNPERN